MNAFNRLLRLYAALIVTVVFAPVHPQHAFAQANCGLVALTVPVGPTGCDVQFGISTRYDGGYETSVAMNSASFVFDQALDTDDYDTMVRNHIEKFKSYTGKMEKAIVPCDLFLLSCTLNSHFDLNLATVSLPADRNLSSAMTSAFPNKYG